MAESREVVKTDEQIAEEAALAKQKEKEDKEKKKGGGDSDGGDTD